MNDTVYVIKSFMDSEAFTNKEMFAAKGLTAIHIMSGNTLDFQNGILSVGSFYKESEGQANLPLYYKLNDIYNSIMP
jgi:hypothetical protein